MVGNEKKKLSHQVERACYSEICRLKRFAQVCPINAVQHGFLPGKSCATQLLEVLDYIGSLLDAGKQTDVIYMDMSKAFDKVNHVALIRKLNRCFNISGNLLCWFRSYLQGRRQCVTVHGATSIEKPVTSGVPQGSILGPILFVLYVNDLPDEVLNSRVASFADDTKIFRRVDSTVTLPCYKVICTGWTTGLLLMAWFSTRTNASARESHGSIALSNTLTNLRTRS